MSGQECLPHSWQWSTLASIGRLFSGGTPNTSELENFDGEIAWITPADLTGYTDKTIGRGRRNITKRGLETSSATLMPARTVMFSSRAPIGYVAIARNEIATNQGFKSVFVGAEIDESYVYHYLKSAKQLAESHASGTTFKEISGARFGNLPIPIAPFAEQQRIVEKIEALFAKLDKGEEAVREVQRGLTRYRQSVLKAAVTGQLTSDWRAERKGKLEHGSDLLERILALREEHWDGRGRYKKPEPPIIDGLSELPEGWEWASVDQLARIMGGLTKNSKRKEMPMTRPMLRVANVYQNRLELDDVHETGISEGELSRVSLEARDILVVEGNGSKSQIGRMAVWSSEIPNAVHQNHLIKVRLYETALAEFMITWFQSFLGRQVVEKVASSTSGLYTLSISKIAAMVAPLPSLEEVNEIMREVEEAHSKIAVLEKWCETELKRAASLRQSILKDAFAGKLVPQDPTDEPASILLARIAASKAPAKNTRRKAKA